MADPKSLPASTRRLQVLLNELLSQGGATAADVDHRMGREEGWMDDLLSGQRAVRPRDLAAIARALGISADAIRARLFAAELGEVTAAPSTPSPAEIRRTKALAVQFETSRALVRDAVNRRATREHEVAGGVADSANDEDETVRETAPGER